MVARLLNLLLIFTFVVAAGLPEVSLAQAPGGANSQKSSSGGPKKQLGIIVFSGVAGGLLGLSTLSFYGRPQDKLANIAIGFALGIITGAVYTTYKAASAPREFYRNSLLEDEQARDRELRYAHGSSPIKANMTVFSF